MAASFSRDPLTRAAGWQVGPKNQWLKQRRGWYTDRTGPRVSRPGAVGRENCRRGWRKGPAAQREEETARSWNRGWQEGPGCRRPHVYEWAARRAFLGGPKSWYRAQVRLIPFFFLSLFPFSLFSNPIWFNSNFFVDLHLKLYFFAIKKNTKTEDNYLYILFIFSYPFSFPYFQNPNFKFRVKSSFK